MSARPQRLLWSPHPNHNQFLIGSTELRLFEWVPEDADGNPHATPIAVNTDVALMKCFTWSPDPNIMDLTAVGLTTGRTLLIKMHKADPWDIDDKHEDYQPETPRQVSIAQNQRTYPSFSARHSRAINVVAFSKGHPNLLSVGLDKVRNDYCLMVWDIEQSLRNVKGPESTSVGSSGPITNNRSQNPPLTSRFGRSGEVVESYFDSRLARSPLSMAESTGSARPLAPSTYDQPTDVRPLCQYGSSEAILSSAWFINQPKVLVAGMGYKYLRVYDTREDQNSPSSLVISTKAVHGLCMDPFHENRMASCQDDGIVNIWDTRNTSEAILSFHSGSKLTSQPLSALVRIAYSHQRAGLLATLTRDNQYIKVWDIQEGTIQSHVPDHPIVEPAAPPPSGFAQGLLSKSQDRDGLYPVKEVIETETNIPILWKSRRTKPSTKALQSFAWVPSFTSNATAGLISINKESLIETTILRQTSSISWEPKGTIALSGGESLTCFPKSRILDDAAGVDTTTQTGLDELHRRGSRIMNLQLPATRKQSLVSSYFSGAGPERDRRTSVGVLTSEVQPLSIGLDRSMTDPLNRPKKTAAQVESDYDINLAVVEQGLEQDISVSMRQNAIRGYSMDATVNAQMVKPGPMKEFWTWMIRAEMIAQRDGAKIGKFDFSYQGVWSVLVGSGMSTQEGSQRSTPAGTPRSASPMQQSTKQDEIPIVPSLKLAQRKLGLKMCGAELLRSDLVNTVEKLKREGKYEMAAGWAFFHGELDLAMEALSCGDEKLKLMAIVVAGFAKNNSLAIGTTLGGFSNSGEKPSSIAWRAQCRSYSRDHPSSYIRAIFLYIASGDWREVLTENTLSLADRVAISLRFLSDEDMMNYMQSTVDELSSQGVIDGILLTGLTDLGIDLLSNYVNNTGDIQTATLAASVAVPRYFKDMRVDEWVVCYRDLLDRWQLYYTRARFDIARGRCMMQNNIGAVSASDLPPTQIYVRCNFCNQSIARNLLIPGVRGRDGRRVAVVPGGGPSSSGPGSGNFSGGLHSHDKSSLMSGGAIGIPGGGGDRGGGGGLVNSSVSSTVGVGGSVGGGAGGNTSKSVVCPSCHKPLPRCAICLLHLGTPAEGQAVLGAWSSLGHRANGEKPTSFDLWFTWCQTCRHGGHSMHMAEWFERHTQCPVSDCACLCSTHDVL